MFKVLLEVRYVSGGGTGDWKRTRVGVGNADLFPESSGVFTFPYALRSPVQLQH